MRHFLTRARLVGPKKGLNVATNVQLLLRHIKIDAATTFEALKIVRKSGSNDVVI